MIYNEVGARTSRSFAEGEFAETVNLAFFGDSMTENIHLPVQYGFTEHLHYLLNHLPTGWQPTRHADPAAKPHFNVLNFGVWGWTTAREYFRWQRVSAKRTFDHVFYVFCRNDVSDFPNQIAYGTVSLDESGNVQRGDSTSVPAWKRLIAHLQLTYLAIDAWKRLAGQAMGEEQERVDYGDERLAMRDARSAVRKLVLRWKREVEAGGGRFHVVLLPSRDDQWMFSTLGLSVLDDDLDVFDLLDCFQAHIPDYKIGDWMLRNDPHWNSAANMIAASCLYRYLEDVLDLPPRTDEALAAARHTYYQAFLDVPSWEGERFAPAAPWVPPASRTTRGPQAGSEAIVNHYLAAEMRQSTEKGSDIVAAARRAGVLAAADWNVFANLPERLLLYRQAPCKVTHDAAVRPFFLHVYPFTREKLSDPRRPYGYENFDRGPWLRRTQDSDECVVMVRLPEWPVARVRTGQFTASDEGGETVYEKHWEVDFAFPLVRSVWDVYAAKGGRGGRRVLDYVKRPCPQAARQARFFLHVYPLRASDLPSTFPRYVNRDFQWNAGADRNGGHYDAAEDSCRISAVLPDFPIDTIRTGQFRDGLIDERLWDVRIRLAETERLASQDD